MKYQGDLKAISYFTFIDLLLYDPTVPYQQSVDLHKKSVEAGVKTEFITVQGGGHGKFEKEKNSEINKKIADFLLSLGLGKNKNKI